MIQFPEEYKAILLEAIEEQMYKVSLELEAHKGKALTRERKLLTSKQHILEKIQHIIHTSGVKKQE